VLRELRIRNFAVVENTAATFGPGLNVLTGETGAGKSIVVDALLLVRGARAQADVIRTETDSATVEAVFEVEPSDAVASHLAEAGIGLEDGTVVIRRELARSGRHRAFVNDGAVTVGLLERLGELLIEVHGQHEHQRLLHPALQLDLLDRFAALDELRRRVAEVHAKHRAAAAAVERERAAARERAQREDMLRFQVGELQAARLRVGEEEELRLERTRLQHAERFRTTLADVQALLHDDRDAVVSRLGRAARLLRDLGRLDPGFGAPAESLEVAHLHVDETVIALRSLRDAIEDEPGRLEAIEERLGTLTRLRRKYGDSEAAMLDFLAEAAADLERLEHHEEYLAGEERRVGELEAELLAAATTLSERRLAAARRLEAAAQREVRELGMAQARFDIGLERAGAGEISARGLDRVEFRLSANPGAEPRPLARIASGGELSRTMLALNAAVLATGDRPATMVFDEVDAGIGGHVAATVGGKLAAVARGGQVLCVTHSPQIAAQAHRHLRVAKAVRGGQTRASVHALEGEARVEEVARMLGGDPPTATALSHARELLRAAGPGPRSRRRPG
jgi:DNA repair protein RecN (Recombination protein N)